jgi:hypothetical protein
MNSQVCKFYLKGNCKRGNKCKFAHQQSYLSILKRVSSPILPKEIMELIFRNAELDLGKARSVCKYWKELLPSQLYFFTGIMNGGYTNGCAVAVARTKLEAISFICRRSFNQDSNPICTSGCWHPRDSQCHHDFKKSVKEAKAKDPYFTSKMMKYIKEAKFYDERNEQFLYSCNLYDELIRTSPNVFPLNTPIGFFCGGGS